MRSRDVVWKYGPLCFGIPISVIGGLQQWGESHGWRGGDMASVKFLILVSLWILVGYVGGALAGWLFMFSWRTLFGEPRE